MSNQRNDRLLERADELIEELTNHPAHYDERLLKAIANNDMDSLYMEVSKIEAELAEEHFHGYDLLVY